MRTSIASLLALSALPLLGGTAMARPPVGEAALAPEPVCMSLLRSGGRAQAPRATPVPAHVPVAVAIAIRAAHSRAPVASPGEVACTASREQGSSYVEEHADRVMQDFFYFQPVLERREDELTGDRLAYLRERDHLMLFRAPATTRESSGDALGVALFASTVVLTAHAPSEMRWAFDGPVHLGPAVFDTGGMGTSVGGRF